MEEQILEYFLSLLLTDWVARWLSTLSMLVVFVYASTHSFQPFILCIEPFHSIYNFVEFVASFNWRFLFFCIRLYSAVYGFNQPTSNIDVAVMDSSFYTAYQNLLLLLLLLYYYGDGLMAMVFITIAAAVVVIGCSVLFSWSLYKQYALWLSTLSVW